MKTKRRQDLRANELVRQLIEIKDYIVLRWNWIVGGLVVIGLAIGLYSYQQHSRKAAQIEGLNRLASLRADRTKPLPDRIDEMNQVADASTDSDVVLAALEMIGSEATSAREWLFLGATDGRDDESQRELAEAAQRAFERIVRDFSDRPEAAARAHLGLATLAENRYDKEEARKHYEAIVNTPQLAAVTMYQSIAVQHLATLDQRLQPVEILPSLPTTQPTTQATTAPAATQPSGELP